MIFNFSLTSMIFIKIAVLTLALGVVVSVRVRARRSHSLPPVFMVTVVAHVLSVVLPVLMRAPSYFHLGLILHSSSFFRALNFWALGLIFRLLLLDKSVQKTHSFLVLLYLQLYLELDEKQLVQIKKSGERRTGGWRLRREV